ncbi:hypothetical protein DSL72_002532 [Monilinia vaccinii-corymbosi]|uniref:Hypersensitive response-inducing protein n=1 Tax=Monilinia vaccinii-corymbosi TaxID=61207 RepID=A0A8A3PCY8_9HELO|nr:hypothetical protein DSL72_002532 [Monilinia vaccinii-corymbosi]
MKFSAAVLSAISVAVASASVIGQRDDNPVFKVTGFSGSCIEHSTQCSLEFSYQTANGNMPSPVRCSDLRNAKGTGMIADIPEWEGKCENSASWAFIRENTGFTIKITMPDSPASNTTGHATLPATDFVTRSNNVNTIEYYKGTPCFNLY